LIIDTWTTVKTLTSFFVQSDMKGNIITAIVSNEILTYHLIMDLSTTNKQVTRFTFPASSPVKLIYSPVLRFNSFTDTDIYALWVSFTNFDTGVVVIKPSTCFQFTRNLYAGKCYSTCPYYEEYDYTNLTCKDCPSYYTGTKEKMKDQICVPSCSIYSQIPDTADHQICVNCGAGSSYSFTQDKCTPCGNLSLYNGSTCVNDCSVYSQENVLQVCTVCNLPMLYNSVTKNVKHVKLLMQILSIWTEQHV